jgi:hypothetical protein
MNFNEHPGHRERHLRRKYDNPLFGDTVVSAAEILQAQQDDAAESSQFLNKFRDLVQSAIALEPSAEADTILKLKEQLDKSYEQCAGLAGDMREIKTMLVRLLHAIMQAMWKGIGNDFMAQQKLEMETQAREQHFAMLDQPLVADLLRPDTVIGEDDLVPTLLSESADAVQRAMQLFNPAQQAVLCQHAGELLRKAPASHPATQRARQRLAEMEAMLQPLNTRPN